MNSKITSVIVLISFLCILCSCNTNKAIADEGQSENSSFMENYQELDPGQLTPLNRKVVRRNVKKLLKVTSKKGRMVADVCINRTGDVIFAKVDSNLTTIKKSKNLEEFIKMIMDYKYETNMDAPEKECGQLMLSFDVPKRKN